MLGASANYGSTTIDTTNGILDMRGQTDLELGAVTGSGTIKNFSVSAAGTLVVGSLNSDFQFDGTLSSDYTSGLLNVTKMGSGNMTLTNDNSANILGTLLISGGNVTLSGSTAKVGFLTDTLSANGSLTLDNRVTPLNNRLGGTTAITGGTRTLSFQGGKLNYFGNNTAATSEALGTVTPLAGSSALNITPGAGASTSITLGTLTASSTTNTGTLTITAVGASAILGGTAGANHVNVTATTAGLTGNIRPDIIGIDSNNPVGGFVTSDTNGLRVYTSADTALGAFTPAGTYLGTATPGGHHPDGRHRLECRGHQ